MINQTNMLSQPKNRKKRIVQLLPSFAEFDAVSNQVVAMKTILEKHGYEVDIYSNHFPKKMKGKIGEAKFLKEKNYDLAIYHHSIGDPIVDLVVSLNIPVIVYYHNITPPDYYKDYNQKIWEFLDLGVKQLDQLAKVSKLTLAASEFNKSSLEEKGFENIQVLPILYDAKRIAEFEIDKKTREFLDTENIVNILFVGRFAPNKAHEDLIKAFFIYHKYYNAMSRLNLVGSYVEMEYYLDQIVELIDSLELREVVHIPGKVSNNEWRTYYEDADVFVSMSEHEGFFVPALEANYFKLPLIAYDAGAVASTVGDAGILLRNKKPRITAEMIHRILIDEELRDTLIKNGEENYKRFDLESLEEKLMDVIKGFKM